MPTFTQNYHAWLQVADNALPKNLIGYIIQLCLNILRTDPFTLIPYDTPAEIAKCGKDGNRAFLPKDLPEREGERPSIGKWIAPHRQVSQLTDPDMHNLLATAMKKLATEYGSLVVVKTSILEKANDAFLIAENIATPHAIAKATSREIAHVHIDMGHCIHVLLSPMDCKTAITKKWAERMPLAGTLVPNEYLIVYTPRTEDEVAAVKSIVAAAILFMSGGGIRVGADALDES